MLFVLIIINNLMELMKKIKYLRHNPKIFFFNILTIYNCFKHYRKFIL